MLKSGATRLADARNLTVSLEGRFDAAYGAAHALCLAKAHDMRNRGEYAGDIDVNEALVAAVIGACDAVLAKLRALPPLEEQR